MRGQKKPAATNAAGSAVLIWVINYFCKLFGKLGFGEEQNGTMWASSPTLERWNGEGVAPLLIINMYMPTYT